MILTKHGKKRVRERVGLPKRAHLRHIKTVLSKGTLFSRTGYKQFLVAYQGFLYIFGLTARLEPILITTYKNREYV